jgi:hypothetical protein
VKGEAEIEIEMKGWQSRDVDASGGSGGAWLNQTCPHVLLYHQPFEGMIGSVHNTRKRWTCVADALKPLMRLTTRAPIGGIARSGEEPAVTKGKNVLQ